MSETARHLVTIEEFYEIPEEDGVQMELLDGVVYTAARPRRRHQHAAVRLSRRIGGPFDQDDDGPGGWWILPEMMVRFGRHDAVEPDLAGWRRERLTSVEDGVAIDVIPDWICEILSPSTTLRDRTAKTRLYARHGVAFLWIVDPRARILEAYSNHEGRWLQLGIWADGERAAIPPFDGITLDIGALFMPRPPDIVAEEEGVWGP